MKALVGPFNQEKALVYAFSNSRRQVSHDNTTVDYAGRDTTLCWSEPRSGVQWPLAAPLVSAAAAEHQLRSGPASRSTVQPHHTCPLHPCNGRYHVHRPLVLNTFLCVKCCLFLEKPHCDTVGILNCDLFPTPLLLHFHFK